MKCRHCGYALEHPILDLGHAPPSNAYLRAADLSRPETWLPLKLQVCNQCWLVQTEDYLPAEKLFDNEYAYFSSTSVTWLEHARQYVEDICARLQLDTGSFVVEVASNDGYLLKNFVERSIPCLGIEPTASTAAAAEKLGIPVLRQFFGADLGKALACDGRKADLIVGNNVFAHVPDINDFSLGLSNLLKPGGTVTLEFPHLLQLIAEVEFDTVYHEHYSYLSLYAVRAILARAGLRVFDVEQLQTHGGSLRVYACHMDDPRPITPVVSSLIEAELEAGLASLGTAYCTLQTRAEKIKHDLLEFLLMQKRAGKLVAAYGAAAKGNTLLNFAGIKPDLLPFVCDAAPSKQGKYLPGSHIPILEPWALRERRPDYVLILPWNIATEIVREHGYIESWGGRFMVAMPSLKPCAVTA